MLYHVLLILFSLYVQFDEFHSCISMEIWNIIKPLFHSLMKLTVKKTFSLNEKVKKHEKTLDLSWLTVQFWSYLSFQTLNSWSLLFFLEFVNFAVTALNLHFSLCWLTLTHMFFLNVGERNGEAFLQKSGIQLFLKKNKIDGDSKYFQTM